MSEIKMLVDRLFIKQSDGNIVISQIENEGLKVEEHFVTTDGEEVGMFLLLTKDEKEALIKYLLEKTI